MPGTRQLLRTFKRLFTMKRYIHKDKFTYTSEKFLVKNVNKYTILNFATIIESYHDYWTIIECLSYTGNASLAQ